MRKMGVYLPLQSRDTPFISTQQLSEQAALKNMLMPFQIRFRSCWAKAQTSIITHLLMRTKSSIAIDALQKT